MRYIGIKYVHGRKEDLLINTYSWEFCEAMIIIFLIIGVQVESQCSSCHHRLINILILPCYIKGTVFF